MFLCVHIHAVLVHFIRIYFVIFEKKYFILQFTLLITIVYISYRENRLLDNKWKFPFEIFFKSFLKRQENHLKPDPHCAIKTIAKTIARDN